MKCPKCGKSGGDDWSQCKGDCPMKGSPHYKRYEFKTDSRGPYIWDRELNKSLSIKEIVELLNQEKNNED